MSARPELEYLELNLDDSREPPDNLEVGLQTVTPEEEFAKELEKKEDQIVDLFVHGASIEQLINRFPKYSDKQLQTLITSKLSIRHRNPDYDIGAGIMGFEDDIKALNEFINEEAQKGSAIKLGAIRTRADIREKKLKYMQSTGVLPDKSNPFEGLQPGTARLELEQTQTKRVTQDFTAKTPEERLKMIEEMENAPRDN